MVENVRKVRVEEWNGPTIYYGRDIETHIYDMNLNEVPVEQQIEHVSIWELPTGKYILLRKELPTLIEPRYDYEIVCLDVEANEVRSTQRKTLAYVSFSKDDVVKDPQLFNDVIFTLMRKLQSMC
jgi:hypothetical protein